MNTYTLSFRFSSRLSLDEIALFFNGRPGFSELHVDAELDSNYMIRGYRGQVAFFGKDEDLKKIDALFHRMPGFGESSITFFTD